MFGTIVKKRLSSVQFANIFINVIFSSTEEGFEYVSELINNDPCFVTSPQLNKDDYSHFQMIILTYNFETLEKHFEPQEIEDIRLQILSKLAEIYKVDKVRIKEVIKHYTDYMVRVNHPSKKLFYGIAKAIFFKYKLSQYQEEYFKRLQVPNPLLLKRLDNITSNFVWDWDNFIKKYKI